MSASHSASDELPTPSLRIFYGAILLSLVAHIVMALYLLNARPMPLVIPFKILEVQIEPPRAPLPTEKPHPPEPIVPGEIKPAPKLPKIAKPERIQPTPIRTPQPTTTVLSTAQPTETKTVSPTEPPSPPEPRKAAPPREETLTAPEFAAAYLNNPKPAYPARAKILGLQGTVLLHVLVDAEGKPQNVTVEKGSGFSILDDSALETVRKSWRFVPARRGETNVPGEVRVPIPFILKTG